MSQGTIGTAERPTVHQRSDARARGRLISKNDFLPLMALFGAVFGWVLVVVAAIVAVVVLLVG